MRPDGRIACSRHVDELGKSNWLWPWSSRARLATLNPLSVMNEQFLSLSDAESYTGKSRSSLRRFVEAITKPDNHPDRPFILPSVEEVADLHKANHPFSWRVSSELLDRKFKKEGSQESADRTSEESSTTHKFISLLEETVAMLNNELEHKNRQIAEFQERQRETNILLSQTTDRLVMLTEGSKQRTPRSEDAITVNRGDEEEGSRDSKSKGRRSLWERLNVRIF